MSSGPGERRSEPARGHSRDGLRWLGFCLGVAAWCTGWLWLLLALTRPFPGVISDSPGVGAMDLLEVPTGRSHRTVLFGVFLLCLLVPLLLGMLRRVLDPTGRVLEALRWPLRAPGFVLACLAWIVLGAAAVMAWKSDTAMLVGIAVMLLAWVLTPFLAWNPSTLDSAAPARWWRAAWPGWRAIGACLLLWLPYAASSIAVDVVEKVHGEAWSVLAAWLIDALVSASLLLAAMHLWLNRGSLRAAFADLARFLRSGGLAEYVWLNLLTVLLLAALLFPLLVIAVESVFVLPQYGSLAQEQGTAWPWRLQLISAVAGSTFGLVSVVSVPVALYLGLATAWLLRRHGAGRAAGMGS